MTRKHYADLLAPIYGWMLGDRALAMARSRDELASLGIGPARRGARALDLGAGLGLQSIPLAELGYDVTALDTSAELLAELGAARPDVRLVHGELADVATLAGTGHDVIVCMGDTITHLPTRAAVDRLLVDAVAALAPGGTLALTFRDHAAPDGGATDRFVLVRADADRILTCALAYRAERVRVTDLVHERRDGAWSLRASSYDKLRLPGEWVAERLRAHGATVTRAESIGGRVAIVAERRVHSSAAA